ncbi:hypothetical protein KCP71_16025 [Salmonella enterica subsp. enterica]|nr:hypothetical protein KCP71_16025 [Salmonella enterica subsp. enterica]
MILAAKSLIWMAGTQAGEFMLVLRITLSAAAELPVTTCKRMAGGWCIALNSGDGDFAIQNGHAIAALSPYKAIQIS